MKSWTGTVVGSSLNDTLFTRIHFLVFSLTSCDDKMMTHQEWVLADVLQLFSIMFYYNPWQEFLNLFVNKFRTDKKFCQRVTYNSCLRNMSSFCTYSDSSFHHRTQSDAKPGVFVVVHEDNFPTPNMTYGRSIAETTKRYLFGATDCVVISLETDIFVCQWFIESLKWHWR